MTKRLSLILSVLALFLFTLWIHDELTQLVRANSKCFTEFLLVGGYERTPVGPNPLAGCKLEVCGWVSPHYTHFDIDMDHYQCYVFRDCGWHLNLTPGNVLVIRWCLVDEKKQLWRVRGVWNFKR